MAATSLYETWIKNKPAHQETKNIQRIGIETNEREQNKA